MKPFQSPLRSQNVGGFESPKVEVPGSSIRGSKANTKWIKSHFRHSRAIRCKCRDNFLLLKLVCVYKAVSSPRDVYYSLVTKVNPVPFIKRVTIGARWVSSHGCYYSSSLELIPRTCIFFKINRRPSVL